MDSMLNLKSLDWDSCGSTVGGTTTAITSTTKSFLGVLKGSQQKSSQSLRQTQGNSITKLTAVNSNLVIAVMNTSTGFSTIQRWQVRGTSLESHEEIELPDVSSVDRIFSDLTGNHVIILCSGSGISSNATAGSTFTYPVYYIHSRSNKAKRVFAKLPQLDNTGSAVNKVECVAFHRGQCFENLARNVLVATSLGYIYEFSLSSEASNTATTGAGDRGSISLSGGSFAFTLKEKLCNTLFQLSDYGNPLSITSMQIDATSDANNLVVMCVTTKPTRIYHFIGGPTLHDVFHPYSGSITGGGGGKDDAVMHYQSHGAGSNSQLSYTDLPVVGENENKRADLHIQSTSVVNTSSSVNTFALLTEMGIYHGSLLRNSTTQSSGSEAFTLEVQFLPFHVTDPNATTEPLSLAVTDHHFLVLFADRIQMICRINGTIVHDEMLSSSSMGMPLGILRDISKNTFWFYTISNIFQVNLKDEDRFLWSIYLNKANSGGNESMFDAAYNFCKTDVQRTTVKRAVAEFHLSAGRLEKAAVHFARSGLPFAQVALLLVNCAPAFTAYAASSEGSRSNSSIDSLTFLSRLTGKSPQTSTTAASTALSIASPEYSSRQSKSPALMASALTGLPPQQTMEALFTVGSELTAVRIYLQELLKVFTAASNNYNDSNVSAAVIPGKSQRTMLCTWLCEIYLHQIAAAAVSREPDLEEELTVAFKDMLRSYKQCLDSSTTFSLIGNHNNRALLLFYSKIVGDYKRVVNLHMTERKYREVINVLNDAPAEKVAGLIYKTAPILIEMHPEETVAMWLSKCQSRSAASTFYSSTPSLIEPPPQMLQLSIACLLPALLRYLDVYERQKLHPTEPRVDVDFEGNTVNFAIRFLQQILLNANLGFSFAFTKNHLVQKSRVGRSSIDSGISSSSEVDLDELLSAQPPSPLIPPCLLHSLVWMLAKYEGSASDHNSDLVALLSHLLRLRQHSKRVGAAGWVLGVEGEVDCEYLLRQCRVFGRRRACVFALLLLESVSIASSVAVVELQAHVGLDVPAGGLVSEAVEEALSAVGDLQLAKEIAGSEQHSQQVRKELWMLIARHVIESNDSGSSSSTNGQVKANNTAAAAAIALIRDSNNAITIDDLLPILPDFTEIEFLKEEVCQSLEACEERIQTIKMDMNALCESIESTSKELDSMKDRSYSMNHIHQKCEFCSDPLLSSTHSKQPAQVFYLFPCTHGFHAKCLLRRAKSHLLLEPSQLSAVRGLEEYLRALSSNPKDTSSRQRTQQEAYQLELDGYIAADCPLCGFAMIKSITMSLISPDDAAEAKSWEL